MITPSDQLRERIRDKTARIGVVGLGYVGLPTAIAYATAGFEVLGFERDAQRRDMVNAGRSYIGDVKDEQLLTCIGEGKLQAVSDLQLVGRVDALEICVPTPLSKGYQPDLSAIVDVTDHVRRVLRPGQLIILASTTYPGTTKDLVLPVLESSGLAVGRDFHLAFAPERIDPGNPMFRLRTLPRVVGGVSPECTEMAAELLGTIVDRVIAVTDSTTAEMTKVLENTFRSINIAHANETAIICEKLGISVWEVIRSAATKPFGFMPFYPGPGIGGHCIPIDPSYLAWRMREVNYTTRFIDLANEVNRHMPMYVCDRAADLLNRQSKSVNGSKVLLLGLSYKANIGDTRESPSLDIARLLEDRGAHVRYCDPHVDHEESNPGHQMESADLSAALLEEQDLVIVTADHDAFDWAMIRRHARSVLDTRGTQHGNGLSSWHLL